MAEHLFLNPVPIHNGEKCIGALTKLTDRYYHSTISDARPMQSSVKLSGDSWILELKHSGKVLWRGKRGFTPNGAYESEKVGEIPDKTITVYDETEFVGRYLTVVISASGFKDKEMNDVFELKDNGARLEDKKQIWLLSRLGSGYVLTSSKLSVRVKGRHIPVVWKSEGVDIDLKLVDNESSEWNKIKAQLSNVKFSILSTDY